MAASDPRVRHRTEQVGGVVEAFDLEALDGDTLDIAVIGHQAFAAGLGDALAADQLLGAADAGGFENFVFDFVAKQGGADQHIVVVGEHIREGGDVTGAQGGDALWVEVAAGSSAAAEALDFVLLVEHRGAPGFAVVGEERCLFVGLPENRQAWRPAAVGLLAVVVTQRRVVVERCIVFLALVGDVVVAQGRGHGHLTEGDGVLDEVTLAVDATAGHEARLVVAVVVQGRVVFAARHPHLRVALVAAYLESSGEGMFQRPGGKQAGVAHIEHLVGVFGVHLASARRRLEVRSGIALVGLLGIRHRVLHLQVHQRVVDWLVFVGGRPGGIGGGAIGQVTPDGVVVAPLVDIGLSRWCRVSGGGERRPALALRARPGKAQAVLVGQVQVELEQRTVQVQGAVGQALGVDRVIVVRVGQGTGQFHVVAVTLGQVDQGIHAAIIGTAEQCRTVDLLVVVAGVTVLEHGAAVAAFLQQVRGILGGHVDAAAEAAVAGVDRVRAFLHFDVLDQLRLDEDGALLITLEAAFGCAIDGHRHVFGVAQAPDVDGLATGLDRAAHVHPRQGRQHAGNVAGLVAVDVFLGQGRAADGARVDLLTVAHDAHRAELDAVVGGRVIFAQAHHVGAADLDHGEAAVAQQLVDGLLSFVRTVQGRSLHAAQQGFVEQQLHLGLLGQLAQ
ncbi:hypothetical protein D3C77_242720 [compost metagenome]